MTRIENLRVAEDSAAPFCYFSFSMKTSETVRVVRCGEDARALQVPLSLAGVIPGLATLRQECDLADCSVRCFNGARAEYLRTFRLRLPVRLTEPTAPISSFSRSRVLLPSRAEARMALTGRICVGLTQNFGPDFCQSFVAAHCLCCGEHAATVFVFMVEK